MTSKALCDYNGPKKTTQTAFAGFVGPVSLKGLSCERIHSVKS